MAKPAILAVDDDVDVLKSVERDLRTRYAKEYRVLRADSGEQALETLKQLKLRGDSVALFLVDQRMPGMSGVDFLAGAMKLEPEARRVLLTAYSDTDAAIRAINQVRLDHYLMKPWDPPEQHLYPVLDDLLNDWQASHRPPFEGLRVIGFRWEPRAHELKDFLGRNQIPFQWLEAEARERDPETRRLLESLPAGTTLPAVVFPDGQALSNPAPQEVAKKAGLKTTAETSFYDFAIVGAGPAGLAAAVYGASEGLETLLVDREGPGGQAGQSSRIENYLGFPSGLSGADLARRAVAQASRFGAEILAPQEAVKLRTDGPYRILTLRDGAEITSHAVLIATGLTWRRLNVPGVDRLTGAGVYYGAAMTEALSCSDQDVYVVGGANSAGQSAVFFARYARKVVILCRSESIREGMSQYLVEQIEQIPNIEVWNRAGVEEAMGETHLEKLRIRHGDGSGCEVAASALFVFIGAVPCTEWLRGVLPLDNHGFVLAGPDLPRDGGARPKGWPLDREPYLLETGLPGVFVAGDTRFGSIKRVASSVGEGSICVQMVHQYLSNVR
ncbi:MAG: FAD-dependent oxidoreductase [Bryobacteraceae bacterium]|nr:FAD-dependent oxidoreductase [Bryobacteraceae bacterium]